MQTISWWVAIDMIKPQVGRKQYFGFNFYADTKLDTTFCTNPLEKNLLCISSPVNLIYGLPDFHLT